VLSDIVAVAAEGRVTPLDAGLYDDEQGRAWQTFVDAVHEESECSVGVRLGHAGRRGATEARFAGVDRPLRRGAWPLLAPSAIAYGPRAQTPKAMDRADMEAVREQFVAAARRAAEAGFDLLELHMGHGYLLSSFVSPLSNHREDEHGGALEARMFFPLEVFDAVRAVWPAGRPLAVCLNATDWARDGIGEDDVLKAARALKAHGCDLIDVVAGQVTGAWRPAYGRYFLAPHSERIRNEAGIATLVGGRITSTDEVNTVLAAGRADLCLVDLPGLAEFDAEARRAASAPATAGSRAAVAPRLPAAAVSR
jgi:anthraniloyl-CoA monooxygenase